MVCQVRVRSHRYDSFLFGDALLWLLLGHGLWFVLQLVHCRSKSTIFNSYEDSVSRLGCRSCESLRIHPTPKKSSVPDLFQCFRGERDSSVLVHCGCALHRFEAGCFKAENEIIISVKSIVIYRVFYCI